MPRATITVNDIDKRKRSRAWIVPKTEDKNAFNVEENATASIKDRETPGELWTVYLNKAL